MKHESRGTLGAREEARCNRLGAPIGCLVAYLSLRQMDWAAVHAWLTLMIGRSLCLLPISLHESHGAHQQCRPPLAAPVLQHGCSAKGLLGQCRPRCPTGKPLAPLDQQNHPPLDHNIGRNKLLATHLATILSLSNCPTFE